MIVETEMRREVVEFAMAMEAKLRKNDHKTGWKDQPIEAHLQLLNIEMMELKVALEFLTFDEACKELVDIANFAMMIRNKLMTQGKDAFRGPPRVVVTPEMEAELQSMIERHDHHRAGHVVWQKPQGDRVLQCHLCDITTKPLICLVPGCPNS